MQADVEKSIMDGLDKFLIGPGGPGQWGAPTREKVDRSSWGRTSDALASQQAMMAASPAPPVEP